MTEPTPQERIHDLAGEIVTCAKKSENYLITVARKLAEAKQIAQDAGLDWNAVLAKEIRPVLKLKFGQRRVQQLVKLGKEDDPVKALTDQNRGRRERRRAALPPSDNETMVSLPSALDKALDVCRALDQDDLKRCLSILLRERLNIVNTCRAILGSLSPEDRRDVINEAAASDSPLVFMVPNDPTLTVRVSPAPGTIVRMGPAPNEGGDHAVAHDEHDGFSPQDGAARTDDVNTGAAPSPEDRYPDFPNPGVPDNLKREPGPAATGDDDNGDEESGRDGA